MRKLFQRFDFDKNSFFRKTSNYGANATDNLQLYLTAVARSSLVDGDDIASLAKYKTD